jgi:hypothetical protein
MATTSYTTQTSEVLLSTFDYLLKPDVQHLYVQKYKGNGLTLYSLFQLLGMKQRVKQVTNFTNEQPRIIKSFSPRTNVTGGLSISVTLSTADVNTNNTFYPQVGMQVMTTDKVRGKITVIDTTIPSAPVLTIEADNVPFNNIAAGTPIINFSRRSGEGTGQPNSTFTQPELYQYYNKIIKGTSSATGTARSVDSWLTDIGGNPIPGSVFAIVADLEEEMRLQRMIGGALMFDQVVTNANALTELGETNVFGLVPAVLANGNSTTTTPGSFGVADMDYIVRVFDAEVGCLNNLIVAGGSLYQDIENGVVNTFTQNPIVFSKTSGGGSNPISNEQAVRTDSIFANYNVRGFSKGNYFFHLAKIQELNDPETYGAAGFTTPDLGVIMPLDPLAGTGKEGIKGYIELTYLDVIGNGGAGTEMKIWKTGANAPIPTNQIDNLEVNYKTHTGIRFKALNKFMVLNG